MKHFEVDQAGAIGIAGTPYAAWMPGSWWGGGVVNQYILPTKSDQPDKIKIAEPANNRNEVVLLDGVWMCIRRSLFEIIKFDEHTYTGFHFYDADICMQINGTGYKLYSVFDILIAHFTKGRMDKSWCENAMAFNTKWKKDLPVSVIKLSQRQQFDAELKTLKEYIYNLIYNGYTHRAAYTMAIAKLFSFRKGMFYQKTLEHLIKYCYKWLIKYP